MLLKLLTIVAVLATTACQTVRKAYVRDGVAVYEASCNGTMRDWNDCFDAATSACKGEWVDKGNSSVGYRKSIYFVCRDLKQ